MTLLIATWNINSVRRRVSLVERLLREEAPDILCLQECKSPVEHIPFHRFDALGYSHWVARGEKGYNGVAILSRVPLRDAGSIDFARLGQARHVAAVLDNGVTIHNIYVPAGGETPDPIQNPKFQQKLDYLRSMRCWFEQHRPVRSLLVGDLNIAPRADDVWDHAKMIKVVSHTPQEVAQLRDAQQAGGWVDITRRDIPAGRLFSWWSYRARDWSTLDRGRRLDHIWASADLAGRGLDSRILRHVRGWEAPSDHAPVLARFAV